MEVVDTRGIKKKRYKNSYKVAAHQLSNVRTTRVVHVHIS